MSEAADITSRAKSNLAFALRVLPRARREDMTVFYAFCRSIDDLADDEGLTTQQRSTALHAWKTGIVSGFREPTGLQRDLISLRERHRIPNRWLTAIIEGCEQDLVPRRFATWKELDAYIWKVAGAVGLVSTRLLGCTQASAETYAEQLGRALQITNILRDVGEDLARGRIYLPQEDFARHGIDADALADAAAKGRLTPLLAATADRARVAFTAADAALPAADRKALLPARIMSDIYQDLLARMTRDGFRVLGTRYRVPAFSKLRILAKRMIAGRFLDR